MGNLRKTPLESHYEGETNRETRSAQIILDPGQIRSTSSEAADLTDEHIRELDDVLIRLRWHLSAHADRRGYVSKARSILRRPPAKLFKSSLSVPRWIARQEIMRQLPTGAQLGIKPGAGPAELQEARRLAQAIRDKLSGRSVPCPDVGRQSETLIKIAARKGYEQLGAGRTQIITSHIRSIASIWTEAGYSPTVARGSKTQEGTPFTQLVCALLNLTDPSTGRPIHSCLIGQVFDLCRNHKSALKGRARRRVVRRG